MTYKINTFLKGAIANQNNVVSISDEGVCSLLFTVAEGYKLPEQIIVRNASIISWTVNKGKNFGTLILNEPVNTVTIAIFAVKVSQIDLSKYISSAGNHNVSVKAYAYGRSASENSNSVQYKRYDINLDNISHITLIDGPTVISQDSSATLTFAVSDEYEFPNEVFVSGAESYWDSQAGILVISNPTTTVHITLTAVERLDTPDISVVDTIVFFDDIENAVEYEVFINDVSIGTYTVTR